MTLHESNKEHKCYVLELFSDRAQIIFTIKKPRLTLSRHLCQSNKTHTRKQSAAVSNESNDLTTVFPSSFPHGRQRISESDQSDGSSRA